MKTVIFCGGQGTRLREETEYRPKPLVPIGKFPILWHIMKIYSSFNHNDFILALGYKGDMIKEYFMQYRWRSTDFTLNTKTKKIDYHNYHDLEDWNITFSDTGKESLTSKRLAKLKKHLEIEENFMLTYGDGISDIDLAELIKYHSKKGKIITIVGINPLSQYGIIDIDSEGIATEFKEKPGTDDVINGGFMVINKTIFKYISEDNDIMFEDVIKDLSKKGEVAIYQHKGFWHSMDTYRDYLKLNKLWDNNERAWTKFWDK
jgi:glucose-1-phosphate cytidylyltransferase